MNDTALNTPADRHTPPAAPARDAVVRCQQLTKVFKDFWMRPRVKAVNGIDLEVRPGEVFGLLGPNGSGKSTTIKLILGLLSPTSGRIAVFGKRPEDVATKEVIGYLPEESYLYRFLNARETLDYYGRLFHQPRNVRNKRIDMLLEMVGLEAAQNRPVGEYSKGMQRRIGLAQALINDPKLLILDEPTTGMDPIGTRQIKDLLIRLRDRGKTILLCSHLLADVEDVCDRVSIMFGGRVIEEGTIDDLLTQRDVTTIETPDLDEKTINEIEMVLEKRGQAISRVSHRKQSLEKLFLGLVERERAKGTETSGAGSGGRIAEFLAGEERGGHLPEGAEAAAILDELTRPADAPPSPQPGKAKGDAARPSSSPAADRAPTGPPSEADEHVLAELSGQKPPSPQPSPPPPTETRSAEKTPSSARSSSPPPAAPPSKSTRDEEVDLSVLESLVDAPPTATSRDRSTTGTPSQPPATPKPPADQPTDEAKPAGEPSTTAPPRKATTETASADESPSTESPSKESKAQTQSPPSAPPTEPPADTPRDEQTGDEHPREEKRPEEKPRKEKPKQPQPPPKPEISPLSGEAGLGLMHGVTGPDDDINFPPVDADNDDDRNRRAKPQPPDDDPDRDERPDQSFIDALEDADTDDEGER